MAVILSLAHGALTYLYLDIYENKFWYAILAWFTDVCIVRWFKFAILLYREWHTLLIDLFVAQHMLKIVKWGKIDTPNTHIHDGSFSLVVHVLLSIILWTEDIILREVSFYELEMVSFNGRQYLINWRECKLFECNILWIVECIILRVWRYQWENQNLPLCIMSDKERYSINKKTPEQFQNPIENRINRGKIDTPYTLITWQFTFLVLQ